MPKLHFNASKEIGDLSGKIILITGGTSGLGRETVLSFATHNPAHIYFTGRSQPSAERTIQDATAKAPQTPVTFLKCDLASFTSVQALARDFLSRETRLDILIANAGVMALPPGLTQEGYEIQFGTNHMGHALLVKLLTPILTSTAATGSDVRIIWDSSLLHKTTGSRGIQFDKLKTTQEDISFILPSFIRYGQSKLANLLYARAFAKYNPTITSVSIHPGVANTNLGSTMPFFLRIFTKAMLYFVMIPVEQCAWNQQWAATAKIGPGAKQVVSGRYYEPVGEKGGLSKWAKDEALMERLWEWTEKELEGRNLEAVKL